MTQAPAASALRGFCAVRYFDGEIAAVFELDRPQQRKHAGPVTDMNGLPSPCGAALDQLTPAIRMVCSDADIGLDRSDLTFGAQPSSLYVLAGRTTGALNGTT